MKSGNDKEMGQPRHGQLTPTLGIERRSIPEQKGPQQIVTARTDGPDAAGKLCAQHIEGGDRIQRRVASISQELHATHVSQGLDSVSPERELGIRHAGIGRRLRGPQSRLHLPELAGMQERRFEDGQTHPANRLTRFDYEVEATHPPLLITI